MLLLWMLCEGDGRIGRRMLRDGWRGLEERFDGARLGLGVGKGGLEGGLGKLLLREGC